MSNPTFTKIIRPGTVQLHGPISEILKPFSVFIRIEYKPRSNDRDGYTLSITGVEGPLRSGDAAGGCGQINMSLKAADFVTLAPGWTRAKITRLLDIWGRWHLNDMKPGCIHQRQDSAHDTARPLTLTDYTPTDTYRKAHSTAAAGTMGAEQYATWFKTTSRVDAVCYGTNRPKYESPEVKELLAAGWIKPDKTEQKTAGWVRPEEHSDGLLGKPCPVCGYKYGSAWLYEEVPTDVLAWLQSLPDTDQKPAWI